MTQTLLPGELTLPQAQEHLRRHLTPLQEMVQVPLCHSWQRILAQDVSAPRAVPGWDNSAMDGYALRHADLQQATPLPVAHTLLAGAGMPPPLPPGQAMRLMTGALIPAGADTVVMQEQVTLHEGAIRVQPGQRLGQHIRRAGEDLPLGGVVLRQGQRLGAAELGLLGSLGLADIPVVRPLRVALCSTGSELVTLGQIPGPGQTFDSNRHTLRALVGALGFECLDLGVIPDSPEALRTALSSAAGMADVVLTSGGVSVGEADFVKPILQELGQIQFWKIAMKPGRPLAFGTLGAARFFGLPGNPVAVMVTFLLLVRPALLQLAGMNPVPEPLQCAVRCTQNLKKALGRMEFQRGIVARNAQGEWQVSSTGNQGSGVLRSMSQANCLIVLPAACTQVAAGDLVDILPFSGLS